MEYWAANLILGGLHNVHIYICCISISNTEVPYSIYFPNKPKLRYTIAFLYFDRLLRETTEYLLCLKPSWKVDGNEKWGGLEKWNWLGISLGLWRSMAICHLNMQLLCKKHISFSACYSFITRQCLGKFHPFDPLCLFKMWKLQYGGKETSAPKYWRNNSLFLE